MGAHRFVSLQALRAAVPEVKLWLRQRYWDGQATHIAELRTIVQTQLSRYSSLASARAARGDRAAVLRRLISTVSANSVQSLLIPAVLECLSDASCPAFRPGVPAMWTELLDEFAASWPHFVPLLVSSLIAQMRTADARPAEMTSGTSDRRSAGATTTAAAGAAGRPAPTSAAFVVKQIHAAVDDRLALLGTWVQWLLHHFEVDRNTTASLVRQCAATPSATVAEVLEQVLKTTAHTTDGAPSKTELSELCRLVRVASACPLPLWTVGNQGGNIIAVGGKHDAGEAAVFADKVTRLLASGTDGAGGQASARPVEGWCRAEPGEWIGVPIGMLPAVHNASRIGKGIVPSVNGPIRLTMPSVDLNFNDESGLDVDSGRVLEHAGHMSATLKRDGVGSGDDMELGLPVGPAQYGLGQSKDHSSGAGILAKRRRTDGDGAESAQLAGTTFAIKKLVRIL